MAPTSNDTGPTLRLHHPTSPLSELPGATRHSSFTPQPDAPTTHRISRSPYSRKTANRMPNQQMTRDMQPRKTSVASSRRKAERSERAIECSLTSDQVQPLQLQHHHSSNSRHPTVNAGITNSELSSDVTDTEPTHRKAVAWNAPDSHSSHAPDHSDSLHSASPTTSQVSRATTSHWIANRAQVSTADRSNTVQALGTGVVDSEQQGSEQQTSRPMKQKATHG